MEKIEKLLEKLNMLPEQTDVGKIAEKYIAEMEKGLSGEGSSLPMIPSYLSVDGQIADGEPVIALDAGGTNLRVGLVTFTGGKPETQHYQKSCMPGSNGEVSVEEFFDILAQKVAPLCPYSDTIAFCFSYPVEITSNRDGRIINLSKEVRVKGAAGVMIGQAMTQALRARGVSEQKSFVVLNDTIASLMGGIAHMGLRDDADGLAGLILGTGANSCYLERGERIGKLPGAADMIINCESAYFNGGGGGLADEILDRESVAPGKAPFEKMISGAYIGKLVTNIANIAAQDGLMSELFATQAREGGLQFTTPELDAFMRGQDNAVARMCETQDAEKLRAMITAAFERAAKLVCANIVALVLHGDHGKSENRPFYVVPDGSMFHNSLLFKDMFDRYMHEELAFKLGRFAKVKYAGDANLAGSALAALLNK
ncbi:MAG: hexokinase [Oscillospiraceae bacterium]|jgi:hexokinase|nr:hexokinase [Oscillospiraceae bacterium]